ncbi:sugar ABC transporter ATP-binding protein [Knoellia sp. CPCC 206435]|uniref:sugar ABC transporter ATP-binding protein n=1 Tax=Knoellia terrae TaxID=3404797 RepID=UPI003B435076
MATTMRLEARSLSKTFGSTVVLTDVDLDVAPGEIHALIGQNGSGKSTLVKILTGYHEPDAGGTLLVDGQELNLPVRWSEAADAGVSVVHQDLGLLDQLSVSENIGIGGFAQHRLSRKIDWEAQDAIATRALGRLDVPVSPRAPVGPLNAMRRAEVAIARALRDQRPGEGLVILDEATRSLPREELQRFHGLLRRVVADGTSILMVSHNLAEVLQLADRVTVLRDGAVAAAGIATEGLTEHDLARHMLGKAIETLVRTERPPRSSEVAARVDGLRLPGSKDLSFEVRRGEVVGLTGLPGSGFEAVAQLITGGLRPGAGVLTTAAGRVDLAQSDVATCMALGAALVPEKRILEGLAVELSIRDNIAVPSLRRRGRPWHVGRRWQEEQARSSISRLGIRTRSPQMLVKELSGGNQQKVLFAKWLSVEPDLLVLHEPTQAVDVGARVDILRAITETAQRGVGVLLVSIEPSDLTEVCDRILVHGHDGLREISTEDPDEVLHAIYAESALTSGGPSHE